MNRTERELLGVAGILDALVEGGSLADVALVGLPGELQDALRSVVALSELASQVAHLGASGLCFLTPDGTDYSFTPSGIAAAARETGWHE